MLTWLCRVFSFAPLELMKNEDGIDVHYERAAAEGAAIVRPLADTEWSSCEYTARDIEGNLWSFGTYRPGGG
ncbi:MAG: hypothetical protein M3Q50_02155 [Chloroflexota bacterium]|nr:hypothetical protein [Gemmatimonadota bacterium]MDQ3225421.1 hypothetical protein [Chloroflexota bacterium]